MIPQAHPKVTIIILNWNGSGVLRDCLTSVFSLSYPSYEVVVVDNGSTDDSVQMAKAEFPRCHVIQNETNLGFSRANNQGAEYALEHGADFIFLLNNDTLLDPECLTSLVRRAEADRSIAAVSPKIYFADPPDRLWFAGGTFSYWSGRNGHVGYRMPDSLLWNAPREIEFISGCALLVPKKVWKTLGGFDEILFRSAEDVDWSLRARKAGYTLFYEPKSIVWHRESFDILRNGGRASQLYYYTRNPLFVMWKQAHWWHWLTFLPYHLMLSFKRSLTALLAKDWSSVVQIVQGFRDFPTIVREAGREGK